MKKKQEEILVRMKELKLQDQAEPFRFGKPSGSSEKMALSKAPQTDLSWACR